MKRGHGEGGIDQRSENVFRLRYRVNGKRHAVTFKGTLREARQELRRLLRSGDTGVHVAPAKKTLAIWAAEWIAAGAPGKRRRKVGNRAIERYAIARRSG